MVRFTEWRIEGLTRQGMYSYWIAAQQSENDERKFIMAVHGMASDGDPKNPYPASKEDALRALAEKDPLKDFPYDVDYSSLTEKALSDKVLEFNRYNAKREPGPLTDQEIAYFWTDERHAAFFGDDPVAKRCSVNNKLWMTYRYLCKVQGHPPEIELLKRLIKDDILVAKLYPTSMDMRRYRMEGPPNLVNSSDPQKGIIMDRHVAYLRKTGELSRILKELNVSGMNFPKELLQ